MCSCEICGLVVSTAKSLKAHVSHLHSDTCNVCLFKDSRVAVQFRRHEVTGRFHCVCKANREWKDSKTLSNHVKNCPDVFHAVLMDEMPLNNVTEERLKRFLKAVRSVTKQLDNTTDSPSAADDQITFFNALDDPKLMQYTDIYRGVKHIKLEFPLLNDEFMLYAIDEGYALICTKCACLVPLDILKEHLKTSHRGKTRLARKFEEAFSNAIIYNEEALFDYFAAMQEEKIVIRPIPFVSILQNCFYYDGIIFTEKEKLFDHIQNQNVSWKLVFDSIKFVDIQILKSTFSDLFVRVRI